MSSVPTCSPPAWRRCCGQLAGDHRDRQLRRHVHPGFDLDHLEMAPDGYDGAVAYARSKRAQVVLANAWARRFARLGVSSYAMHPGWADTPGLKAGLPRFEAALAATAAHRRRRGRTPSSGWPPAARPKAAHARTKMPRLARDSSTIGARRREQPLPGPLGRRGPGRASALLDWCAARTGIEDAFSSSRAQLNQASRAPRSGSRGRGRPGRAGAR